MTEQSLASRRTEGRFVFAVFACGILLAVLSALKLFPLVGMARWLSSDGTISDSYAGLIQRSQWTLAFILLALSPLASRATPFSEGLQNTVTGVREKTFLGILALISFTATLAIQSLCFDNLPHVTDATSHLFQAKIFAMGRLAVSIPACHEHFAQEGVIMGHAGLWHTKYLPGQALWLTLGTLLRAWWLPGPLGSAISVVAFYSICRRHMSVFAARSAALLLMSSPLFLLLSASFMSHSTHLMLLLCAAALLHRAAETSPSASSWSFVAFGLVSGFAFLTRPQDTAILAPILLGLLLALTPTQRRLRGIAWSMVGAIPALSIMLLWSMKLYGTPLSIGYAVTANPSQTHIYHDSLGISAHFPFRQALRQTLWTVLRFNKVALGWPASLFLVPFALCSKSPRKHDLSAATVMLCVGALYFFHSYYGFEYEARYYLPMLPAVIWLTVAGASALFEFLARRFGQTFARATLSLFMAASVLHAAFYYWPQYLLPRYRPDYEQCSSVVSRAAQKAALRNAIVLISTQGDDAFRYSSGFVFNDPMLSANVIYARDLGEKNRCFAENFPGRAIYQFVPNADWTSGRFELVEF
ncbi:MAG TPA: glycosyltransferase family 39 protein [Kiritimatiellia bacterium]|nr:glycosyltransferase family 39 protein [Kiritimatiellia bacterium]